VLTEYALDLDRHLGDKIRCSECRTLLVITTDSVPIGDGDEDNIYVLEPD